MQMRFLRLEHRKAQYGAAGLLPCLAADIGNQLRLQVDTDMSLHRLADEVFGHGFMLPVEADKVGAGAGECTVANVHADVA